MIKNGEHMIKKRLILVGLAFALACATQAKPLEQEFRDPSMEYRPSCFWPWIGGHITKEGIHADLLSMKQVGMGGATIFDLSLYIPEGSVKYGSAQWRDLVDYAIQTGADMGLAIGLQNCPGWSTSGGPWVTPEQSMKRLVFSEVNVTAPVAGPIQLPIPPTREDFYRDVAVLAIPAEPASACTITSTIQGQEPLEWKAGTKMQPLRVKSGERVRFDFIFNEPVEKSSLQLDLIGNASGGVATEIEASMDGTTFKPVAKLSDGLRFRGRTTHTCSFPATKAKVIRVNLVLPGNRESVVNWQIADIGLFKDARIPGYEMLSLGSATATRQYIPSKEPSLDGEGSIPADQILNATGHLQADGLLAWEPPPGAWTILRFGFTATGSKNHPAREGGEGLEVDKMDAAAVKTFFQNSLGEILARAKPEPAIVFGDSWEAGSQNWTEGFAGEFLARNGYEITPFLPVLTGRYIQSPGDSLAFLRDFRRTIGELIAEKYFRVMREEANRHGLKWIVEPYVGFSFDEFVASGEADGLAGEFWVHDAAEAAFSTIKRTSSMTETMKQDKEVGAESFTARPADAAWQATPRSLKLVADGAFCRGLNRIILHSVAHQPREDMRPGFTHGRYGTEFGRHNTWWPLAGPFMDYLARAGVMLRQGNRVADFLFMKNDGPFSEDRFPDVPPGYDFLFIAPSTLLQSQAVDGRVVTPGGGSHAIVVFPKRWVADIPLLEKLGALRKAGVTLLGEPPVMPSGRRDLKEHQRWDDLRAALWPASSAYPKADTLAKAAQAKGLAADFSAHPASAPLDYVHRRDAEKDIYFVHNTTDQPLTAEASFRVTGKGAQFWNPVDGSVAEAPASRRTDDRTGITVNLASFGSTFVVFHGPENPGPEIVSPKKSVSMPSPIPLPSWKVTFAPAMGKSFERDFPALVLWNENDDEAIKHFSGPATYTTTFQLPALETPTSPRVVIDLGRVFDLAEVTVNGKLAGTVWTDPNTLDITPFVVAGTNEIRIKVVNRWINRLIGDEFLPEEATYKGIATDSSATAGVLTKFPDWYTDPSKAAFRKRTTFATWKHYDKNSPLVPSGLIGPVFVRFGTDNNRIEKK